MRHRVAGEAHPAQHQDHADRRAAEGQREAAGQGAAHERELVEGLDQERVERLQDAAAVRHRALRRRAGTRSTIPTVLPTAPRRAASWRR